MGKDGQRRLTAIVFTDIVGYSAIVHRDEALGARLLDRQREIVRRILPEYGGREVETAGDSFLLEFDSALAAVQAVIAIQQELARSNAAQPEAGKVVLRASVHLGDVDHRGNEVFGDGVNTAARLLAHSPEGGMALSAPVLGMTRQRIQLPVTSIGTPALKNIASPVEIFTLEAAALLGMPAPSAATNMPSRPKPYRRRFLAALAGVLALAAVFASGRYFQPGNDSAGLAKSVAVLPFSNMSDEKGSQYFADGMQDEILTAIAKIKDLKVISRTSVERYRDRQHDLKEIARALDVATVLEGGVQRSGSKVRINVQLIDAGTDAHLWAETYDRDVSDVFAVQSEIAHKVADALKATLLPAEAQALADIPTKNARAYDLYLQGASLSRQADSSTLLAPRLLPQAIELLGQSVAADPDFALGHATLALTHLFLYWYAGDTSPERLALAKAAADRALALQPESAQAHTALGLYYYWGFYDYPAALEHFERAHQALPNDAFVISLIAAAQRRQGRFEEALEGFKRAAALNPQGFAWSELATTYFALGRDAEVFVAADRALAVSGNSLLDQGNRASWDFFIKGDPEPMQQVLAKARPGTDEYRDLAVPSYFVHFQSRDFGAAARTAEEMPEWVWVTHGAGAEPKALLAAHAYAFAGEKELARKRYAEAMRMLDARIKAQPDEASLRSYRAFAHAGLGHRREALADAERAVELMPASRDALSAPRYVYALAQIHAQVGDHERALELLRRLLATPAGGVRPGVVRREPFLDPLRKDPRFAALLAETGATAK